MVFDAAFLAGTAASLMMNGACCYYQSNREDELREDLREEIRREWHSQRRREMAKLQERKDLQSSEFEDRYRELMQRSSEEHMSYAEKHNIFVSGSNISGDGYNSGSRLTAASVYSTDTPYPGSDRHRQDPPSVNALLISRNSSILEENDNDDDDDDDDDDGTNLMLVTDAGSDIVSLEDVSITSG